jgi:hypothetical protein
VDKVKSALAWAKKHRFWLSSGFLAIAMVGCWLWATMAIDKDSERYTSEVKTKITQVESILKVSAEEGVQAHPNSVTEEGMQALLNQSADEIVKAWKLRYDAQSKILQWPKEIQADEKFIAHFDHHNPPETYPGESEKGIEGFSLFYLNQIPRQMERICKDILRAKWNYDPAYKDSQLTPEEELSRFAVVWDDTNQELWNQKLTRFQGYDDHANSMKGPTGLQIYMLQQDLWLLEAMFEVIRQINGDVHANDLAKIKKIDHVVFGREANSRLGKLSEVHAGQIAATSNTMGQLTESPTGDTATPSTFDPFASKKPFHGRYVDASFNPISADDVLKVLQAVKRGETLPDSRLELVVAKRVPVRIALKMDEREIPNFMTACANSPFAFEIHQVRKNRHVPGEGIVLNGTTGTSIAMAGGPRGSGRIGASDVSGARSGGGGRSGRPGGAGGSAAQGSGNTEPTKGVETRTSYDVDVEFFGVVKIYNPVSENYLRKIIDASAAQASVIPAPRETAYSRGALVGMSFR